MNERERNHRVATSRAGRKAVTEGKPTSWFEPLYQAAAAADEPTNVPWVDLKPNQQLVDWLDREEPVPCRAMVIGCGLGDDAEELARRGFEVSAFDLSPTAVQWCRDRYPESTVDYQIADMLKPPVEWDGGFDFVVEVYTVQSLPLSMREEATRAVSNLVAPGGCLLVIAFGRPDDQDDPMGPPWPLSSAEMKGFEIRDLQVELLEEYDDPDDQSVRRLRGFYHRKT